MALRQKDEYLVVVHVYDTAKSYLPPKFKAEHIKETFEVACVSRVPKGRYEVRIVEAGGLKARDALVRVTRECGAKLLVVGSHGRKGPKQDPSLLGTTANAVLREASCTALIVKKTHAPLRRPFKMLVAIDGERGSSERAYEEGLRLCAKGDSLSVVHVFDPSGADQKAEERVAVIQRHYRERIEATGLGGRFVLRESRKIVESVLEEAAAQECDLMVIGVDGMRAYSEKRHFLGSICDKLVQRAQCHVLVTKPPNPAT